MRLLEKLRANWRLGRYEAAKFALADAEHELSTWGSHFGTKPSDRARMERAVERAEANVAKLKLGFGE